MRRKHPMDMSPVVLIIIVFAALAVAYFYSSSMGLATGGSIRQAPAPQENIVLPDQLNAITVLPEIPSYVNEPGVKRWTVMDFDPLAFQEENPQIIIPFSSGNVILNLVEDQENASLDPSVWYGKIAGDDLSSAIIVRNGAYAAAEFLPSIKNENGKYYSYSLYPYSEGKWIAMEVDPSLYPPFADVVIDPDVDEDSDVDSVPDPASEITAEIQSGKKAPLFFSGNQSIVQFQAALTTIDVMVTYTNAAMLQFGTTPQYIETVIALKVAQTNQALTTSLTNTRIRLVHAHKTSYVESSSLYTDLDRFKKTSDGYMDEVHALRNSYGADLMMLWEDDSPTPVCGIANQLQYYNSSASSLAPNAFGAMLNCGIFGLNTFSHELGHEMGMHHDPNNLQGSHGAFSYSKGYQLPGHFRTIMAYDCTASYCPQIVAYSNPNVTYNGLPTGTSTQNNARTLTTLVLIHPWLSGTQTLAEKIASFRSTGTMPLPPTTLSASDGAYLYKVMITWSASQNSTSYDVYRGSDKIGNTTQTSFDDTTGLPDIVYTYSVKGVNSSGTGVSSNTDSGYSVTPSSSPSPPSLIHSTSSTEATADIAWTPTFPAVTENLIFLSTGFNNNGCVNYFKTVGNVTSDTLLGLTPGTTYSISMKSNNVNNFSSACSNVSYFFTPPIAVTDLHASDGGQALKLNWTPAPGSVLHKIYRSTIPGFQSDPSNLLYQGNFNGWVGQIFYTDTTALSGTTYYYRVSGVLGGSESASSLDESGYFIAPPTVSISSAADNTAGEGNHPYANPGRFTVSRTGITTAALQVNLSVSGSAQNGPDYYILFQPPLPGTYMATIPSTIIIPAGISSIDLVLMPVDDTLHEGLETAKVAVLSGVGYIAGSSINSEVSIIDDD